MIKEIDFTPVPNIEAPKLPPVQEWPPELPPVVHETDEGIEIKLEENPHNDIEGPDIDFIERTSRTALFERNKSIALEQKNLRDSSDSSKTDETENKGLSEEEKNKIRKETGWSDVIINAIGSMKEYEVYKKAGLKEAEINGKKCLIRSDIDMNQKDKDGITNAERVKRGLAPLGSDGKPINLHHIGQRSDSPLAELTQTEHTENDSTLHDKTKESEIDRNAFNKEKSDHWKSRAV